MSIVSVSFQDFEFLGIPVEGIHARETKGTELSIKRVKGISVAVSVELGTDEIGGNFLYRAARP